MVVAVAVSVPMPVAVAVSMPVPVPVAVSMPVTVFRHGHHCMTVWRLMKRE